MINLRGKSSGRVVLLVWVLLSSSSITRAHDPGLSAVEVRIGPTQVIVQLSIARSDVVLSVAGEHDQLTENGLPGSRQELEELAVNAIEIWLSDKRLEARRIEINPDQSGAIDFRIKFDRGEGSRLRIRSAAIKSFARGHRQYVRVVDEHGATLGENILDAHADEFEVTTSSSSGAPTRSLLGFLELGVEHILTGYDHLVFLIGLLLVGAGLRDVAKIITSFTAAHSITLALSTVDLVRLSPDIVEPLIAVSIIYVGIENIFRRDLRRRWLLTFVFGLVHGFGFASALRELGIDSTAGAALPLVSFNFGVEIGQMGIALVVLPLIWKFRKRPEFVTRFAPACSILISIAGGFWLVERLV